ncbi:MAG: GTP diphosphokinase [Thiotrichales bacterium]|nr:MAG: GTP diphosphokinase [Thiotrichales bacterium]
MSTVMEERQRFKKVGVVYTDFLMHVVTACDLAHPLLADRHCLQIAKVLHDLGMEPNCVVAAVAYHMHCQAILDLQEISSKLGKSVANLVVKLCSIDTEKNDLANLRDMLLATVADTRVAIIKLVQCLCKLRYTENITTAAHHDLATIAREVYVPLANRLGIGHIKWELEDLVFHTLEPVAYNNVAKLLNEKLADREKYIEHALVEVQQELRAVGIKAEITGRPKHMYSIWQKMQRKCLSYYEIYDKRAIRILVTEITDCYAALGVVHAIWKHIPQEFDDYIARPKGNGYSSLHTAVIGPQGKTIEVQIRTKSMHNQADFGVAAHWRYKKDAKNAELDDLEKILHYKAELIGEDSAVAQTLPSELAAAEISIFTPKGKTIKLSQGATALDFAYHVSVELGHAACSALINGKNMLLQTALVNGNKVEILTCGMEIPNRAWLEPELQFLTSTLGKASITTWFKQQTTEYQVDLGRNILQDSLKLLDLNAVNSAELFAKFPEFALEQDFFMALAVGSIARSQLILVLQQLTDPLPLTNNEPSNTDVNVDGAGSLSCYIAPCCNPIPGDDIVGCIGAATDVMIHNIMCSKALHGIKNNNNELIAVSWGKKVYNPYAVSIVVRAYDRAGLLKELCDIFTAAKVNMISLRAQTNKKDNITNFLCNIEISGVEALGVVLMQAQALANIISAQRMRLQD